LKTTFFFILIDFLSFSFSVLFSSRQQQRRRGTNICPSSTDGKALAGCGAFGESLFEQL
jgi:hypothetical protein